MAKHLFYSLLFFAALLESCVFSGPAATRLYESASANKPYDAIIVPGIPYDTASDNWKLAMAGRIYWAKYLYDRGITSNIIFSGGAVYTPFVESKIMSMYAVSLGVPQEKVFAETKAEHSTENVYYSYYMAQRMGYTKVAVATDPFQAKMLKGYPRKMKVKIDFIPFIIDSLKQVDTSTFHKLIIAKDSARVSNFVSIADRQSRFKRILGTMGKNVIRVEEDVRNRKNRKVK